MNNINTYSYPEARSIVVCGDIHGEFNTLIYKNRSTLTPSSPTLPHRSANCCRKPVCPNGQLMTQNF